MKKYFTLFFAFICSSLLLLSSCGSQSTLKGSFKQSEYVLSLDENIDFLQGFSCKGFSISDLTLSFSNEGIVEYDQATESYVAKASGQTLALAKAKGQTVASANVFVKQHFSAVTGISLSNDGLLSWDESYVIYSGEKIVAKNYELALNDSKITVEGNTYQLDNEGVYNISIQALGSESEKVDASKASESQTFFYKVMPSLQSFMLSTSEEFNNHEVTLRWEAVSGARYKIKAGGIVLAENTIENYITFNMRNFAGGQECEVSVEVIDENGENLSNITNFSVVKLETPEMEYKLENGDGKIVFANNENARSYFGRAIDLSNTQPVQILSENNFDRKDYVETFANGLGFGVYELTVQGKGKGAYANSNVSAGLNFVKLAMPEVEYSVVDKSLILKLQKDENVNRIKVLCGEKEILWNTDNVDTLTIDISEFETGAHDVQLFALPKFDDDGAVIPVKVGNVTSSNVVNSDAKILTFYVLDEIGEVEHSLSGNLSVLSFDKVEFANSYKLTLNGQELYDFVEKDGKIVFEIEDLKNFAPIQGKYVFDISATEINGTSTKVTTSKTLTILGTVTASENQTNGGYAWNRLSEDEEKVEYRYELYQTASDFNITGLPAKVETTKECAVDGLGFGYYVIKVYSKSLDTNIYLDSDFREDTFFTEKFIVTEKIEQPEYSFIVTDDGDYTLRITKPTHATEYEVYVNDVLDGTYSSDASTIDYYFAKNDFVEAGKFIVEVVAKTTAEDGDPVLHPASDRSQIVVTKLASPKFKTALTFDGNGEKQSETISVELIDNAEKAEIFLNGVSCGEVGSVDVKDIVGSSFTLSAKFIAQEAEDKNYYIDSNETRETFTRLSRPTGMKHENGKITFESVDHEDCEKYISFITLIHKTNPAQNYTARYEFTSIPFDINTAINELAVNDNKFAQNYGNSLKNIEVVIYAYSSAEGKLSSLKATSADGEKLTLSRLEEVPVLEFDTETLTLSWKSVGSGSSTTFYDLYIDNELYREDITETSFDLSVLDFSETKKIALTANNASYLSSAQSQPLLIRRLSSVDNVRVLLGMDNKWLLNFDISSDDIGKVQEILVGDQTFTGATVSAELKEGEYLIQVKAVARQGQNIFLDSLKRKFVFSDLSQIQIASKIEDGAFSWEAVGADFVGTNEIPLSYIVKLYRGENEIKNIPTSETTLKLDEIASLAGVNLSSGDYSLEVVTALNNYSLTSVEGNAKGYFNQAQSIKLDLKKLSSVAGANVSVVDSDDARTLDKKQNAFISISFADVWQEDVNFKVQAGELDETLKAGDSIRTTDNKLLMNLALSENGQYTLLIANSLFSQNAQIDISVHSQKAISSDVSRFTLDRLSKPANVSIDKLGKLTLDKVEGVNYVVRYSIGAKFNVDLILQTNEIDLLPEFEDYYSSFSVIVLAFDESGKKLPSIDTVRIEGDRPAPVEELVVDDQGNVNMKLSGHSQVVFTIRKYDTEIDNDILLTGEDGNFSISLHKLIDLFEISRSERITLGFAVNATSQDRNVVIPSPFTDLTFNYVSTNDMSKTVDWKRGRHYGENYIIMDELDGDLETTAFEVLVKYNKFVIDEQGVASLEEFVEENVFLASEISGYWIKEINEAGITVEYFDRNYKGAKYVACYGLELGQLLINADYGKIHIEVTRIAKSKTDGLFTEYAEESVDVTKVNAPTEFKFMKDSKATVTWDWTRRFEEDDLTADSEAPLCAGYIVYITDLREGGGEQTFFVTDRMSLDIFDVLVPNVPYLISVQAVSNVDYQIGSNRPAALNANKYTSPMQVTVIDGKIVFDLASIGGGQNLDFIKYFDENRLTDDNFAANFLAETFSSLFTFNLENCSSQKIRLTFTDGTKSYSAIVNAIDLIPDLSEVELSDGRGFMESLESLITGSSSTASIQRISRFYEALLNANKGVADNQILFDSFGENVPAGNYSITASHYSDPESGRIESNGSIAKTAYVISAAGYELGVTGENNDKYYARFRPVSALFENNGTMETAYAYTMVWRKNSKVYTFDITGDSQGTWVIVARDKNYQISNCLRYENGYVVIDLSLMARLASTIGFDKDEYRVAIFANGNNFAINGKSASFDLEFLDFSSGFTFMDGQLSWVARSNASTKIVTKVEGFEDDIKLISTSANQVMTLPLTIDGNYTLITISLLGREPGDSKISVESDRYAIVNAFKLYAPSAAANENAIVFSQDPRNNMKSIQLEISNNSSQGKYVSDITTGQSYTYYPGQLSGEENATVFSGKLVGNSGVVTSSSVSNMDYQYLLTLTDSDFIFSSSAVDFAGKMLGSISQEKGIAIEDGFLTWEDDENVTLSEGSNVYYKLTVYAYANSSQTPRRYEFFTSQTRFDTALIVQEVENETFNFSVQKFALTLGSENDYDVQTVEGQYLKWGQSRYQSTDQYVLSSLLVYRNENDRKFSSVKDLKVTNGQISWASFDNATSIKYVVIDKNNNQEIAGRVTNPQSQLGRTVFTPNVNAFTGSNPHELAVYAFGSALGQAQLKSKESVLTNVYKLRTVTEQNFDLSFVSNNVYRLNLQNYFERNIIDHSNDDYVIRVKVEYNDNDSQEMILTNKKMEGYITTGDNNFSGDAIAVPSSARNLRLSFVVESAGLLYENTGVNVLNSDASQVYSLSLLEWVEGELSYNSEKALLSWQYSGEAANPQFLINITYQNSQVLSYLTYERSFAPRLIGTIVKVEVRVRNGQSALFSKESKVLEERIVLNIFEQGDGTEANPYIIKNQSQFENIALRNEQDIYFKLSNDLLLTNVSIEELRGVLDGNGHKINISVTDKELLKQVSFAEALVSGSGTNEERFEKSYALFGTIAATGAIKNLEIEFAAYVEVDCNIVLSSLAYENYGMISNCVISKIEISGTSSQSGYNYLALGGIATVNNGTIASCQNTFQGQPFSLTVSYCNFVYGSIAISNNGEISSCFNSGDISLSILSSSSSHYFAGIAISNKGRISACGNDGGVEFVPMGQLSSVYTFAAGISLRLYSEGEILNSYNNAQLSDTSNGGSASIAYLMTNNSLLQNVVSTTSQPMVLYRSAGSADNCYCPEGIINGANIGTALKSGLTIKISENQNLIVKSVSGKLIASIE